MNFLLGVIVVFSCVLGGYAMEGGYLGALLHPAELVIIGGAAFGAFVIANPTRVFKKSLRSLTKMLKGSPYNREFYAEALALVYAILMKIRRDGMMGIESDIEDASSSDLFRKFPKVAADARTIEFICDYFRIMVSGIMNSYEIENLMDIDLEAAGHASKKPSEVFMYLSDSLPAFGIVAAVMGVVITMAAIGGPPAELGEKVGAALVGTFVGILLAYGLVGPIGRLLHNIAEDEEQFFACIKTCVVAHLNGYTPKMVVEFGRMSIAPDLRPSSRDMDDYFRSLK